LTKKIKYFDSIKNKRKIKIKQIKYFDSIKNKRKIKIKQRLKILNIIIYILKRKKGYNNKIKF